MRSLRSGSSHLGGLLGRHDLFRRPSATATGGDPYRVRTVVGAEDVVMLKAVGSVAFRTNSARQSSI